jgi:myosin-5
MDNLSTLSQLRCAGVVAAVTISRSAFPNRLEHAVALDRFSCLLDIADNSIAETRDRVDKLLSALLNDIDSPSKDGSKQKAFVCGKTRVYFRSGSLEYLESRRLLAMKENAVSIQKHARRYFIHKEFLCMRYAALRVQSVIRCRVQRRKFLRNKSFCITIQCWSRYTSACATFKFVRRSYCALVLQSLLRKAVAQGRWRNLREAVVTIQAAARGAIQRPLYRVQRAEAIENAKLENQIKILHEKLEEAERRRIAAEKLAAEKASGSATVVHQESYGSGDEEKKSEVPFTAEQQALMLESGKMLDYLRKEVFKLRTQNAQLRKDFDLIRDNNQRLMESNASAGASFAALNQHAKQLGKTNAKLLSDLTSQKQLVSKLLLAQDELKEELKMKQSTYVAEVQSRLMYQKTMQRMTDLITSRCRDQGLVEDFLAMADSCELNFVNSPTGLERTRSPIRRHVDGVVSKVFSPSDATQRHTEPPESQQSGSSSISAKLFSFFVGGGGSTQKNSPENTKAKKLDGLEIFGGQFTEY